ncbi:hypothetical protein [Desulfovibrio cuneatus]|uniref:hypothetical protein n=1 Tax=Desulfovibrio cuneatus TaxID=159728 RepID=UPI0004889A9C|nr:hypothetical protein [Desulfovibrio cuneatus]
MKAEKEKNKPTYFVEIVLSLLFSLTGLHTIIINEGYLHHGVEVSAWTAWITTPTGLYILYTALKARWRNKQEAKKDAEAAALEEQERETQGDVASGTNENESKKDDPPQGGA